MNLKLKHIVLLVSLLGVVSCGETPTSQLTEQFPILRPGPLNMEFSLIPVGSFRMGSPESEEGRGENESFHWVRLTEDYEMQTTEVTIEQWRKVMNTRPANGGCWHDGGVSKNDNSPIVCINSDEIRDFIDRINDAQKNTGYKYALPTEAQWEYAARAYTETPYSMTGDVDLFAWHSGNSRGHTHSIGELKANFFGLYDVHGNVYEWVLDWYKYDYPKTPSISNAIKNPKGPEYSEKKVIRGGGWSEEKSHSRSANRNACYSHNQFTNLGFRIMRTKI